MNKLIYDLTIQYIDVYRSYLILKFELSEAAGYKGILYGQERVQGSHVNQNAALIKYAELSSTMKKRFAEMNKLIVNYYETEEEQIEFLSSIVEKRINKNNKLGIINLREEVIKQNKFVNEVAEILLGNLLDYQKDLGRVM